MGELAVPIIAGIATIAGSGISAVAASKAASKDRQAKIEAALPDRLKAPLTGAQQQTYGQLGDIFSTAPKLDLPFQLQSGLGSGSFTSRVQGLRSGSPQQLNKSPFMQG